MERAKQCLTLSKEESEFLSKLAVNPYKPLVEQSFYDAFSVRGIRVNRAVPGLVICTYRVPPRLTDRSGNLAPGAIANLIDIIGGAVLNVEGLVATLSVNISVSYFSTAKVDDELEITSRLLGKKGFVSGSVVSIKNKTTGEAVAEGRHIMFNKPNSKI